MFINKPNKFPPRNLSAELLLFGAGPSFNKAAHEILLSDLSAVKSCLEWLQEMTIRYS